VLISTILLCDFTHHNVHPTISSPILQPTLATLSSLPPVQPYTIYTLLSNHLSTHYPPLPHYVTNLLSCYPHSSSKSAAPPRIMSSPSPPTHPKPTNHTVSKKTCTYLQENIPNPIPKTHKHTKTTNLPSKTRSRHLQPSHMASNMPSSRPALFEHALTIPESPDLGTLLHIPPELSSTHPVVHTTSEHLAASMLIHPTTESNAKQPHYPPRSPRLQHRSSQIPHPTNKTTTAATPTPPTPTGRPSTTTNSLIDTKTPTQAHQQLTPKPATKQTLASTFMHLSKALTPSQPSPQNTLHIRSHRRLQIPLPLTHSLIPLSTIHPHLHFGIHPRSDMAPTPEKTTPRSHKAPAKDTNRLEIQLRSKLKTTRSLGTVTKSGHKKATSLDRQVGIASRRHSASAYRTSTEGGTSESRPAVMGPGNNGVDSAERLPRQEQRDPGDPRGASSDQSPNGEPVQERQSQEGPAGRLQ
jgi:hypothetical protein